MALSIVKQPNEIFWSRNPVEFEFHTDKLVLDAGRPLIFTLDFSQVDNIVDSELHTPDKTYYYYLDWSFTLVIKQTELQFSCEYADPGDKFKIPHRIGLAETKQDWLVKVKNAIINTFNLDSIFTATVEGQKIKFTSIENDSSLDAQVKDVTTDLAISIENIQIPVNRSYTPNLKIFVELIAVEENNKRVLVSAALVPDASGNTSWDFSKPLSSLCISDGPDIPSMDDLDVSKGKTVKQFFVRATELFGEPQTPRTSVVTNCFFVAYGGLPKNMQNLSLQASIIDGDVIRFLSSAEEKTVVPDQPSWLSWINLEEVQSDVKVEIELVYNNGTPFIFTAHNIPEVKKYDKVIIPVGLDQIDANSHYPELKIVSYEVCLKSDGVKISNTIKYFIDNTLHQYQRLFIYQNSLGSPESLFTSGKKAVSYEIEKSTAIISQSGTFDLRVGENVDLDIVLENKEKINTGYKSYSEILLFRDFILSRWKLTLIKTQWWPVNISSSSIDEFQDGNGLYALSFEITGQHSQELFF
ncbi:MULTISPECIES: hypothetical protein [Sphingobacterium]|uniref:hypothetical protein n=1 Tax=Sphingobacterium TaxID=28453 RepID=UPI00257F6F5C|nr:MULTISPECIES: hypothetical protein [Sphingobacterium]